MLEFLPRFSLCLCLCPWRCLDVQGIRFKDRSFAEGFAPVAEIFYSDRVMVRLPLAVDIFRPRMNVLTVSADWLRSVECSDTWQQKNERKQRRQTA